jgi:hypothetical protein
LYCYQIFPQRKHYQITYYHIIDWLIIYGFTSLSRIFHLYGDVTIAVEGLQNLGLCSALRAFEQGGIFIVPHLLWHGTSVFPVSSDGLPHSVASFDTRGVCGGFILTRILTGALPYSIIYPAMYWPLNIFALSIQRIKFLILFVNSTCCTIFNVFRFIFHFVVHKIHVSLKMVFFWFLIYSIIWILGARRGRGLQYFEHFQIQTINWICINYFIHFWLLDWLFTVLRPTQEFFIYKTTSPLPVKGCKILAYPRRLGPLRREGYSSCHIYCDTGPRFFRFHPKDCPIWSRLLWHAWWCGGPILTRILTGSYIVALILLHCFIS